MNIFIVVCIWFVDMSNDLYLGSVLYIGGV